MCDEGMWVTGLAIDKQKTYGHCCVLDYATFMYDPKKENFEALFDKLSNEKLNPIYHPLCLKHEGGKMKGSVKIKDGAKVTTWTFTAPIDKFETTFEIIVELDEILSHHFHLYENGTKIGGRPI